MEAFEFVSEEAKHAAAQVWCHPKTRHIVMDVELCKEFARVLDLWIETARQHVKNEEFYRGLLDQHVKNEEFYRGLLDQCAEHIGEEAYTADDGTVYESPVRLKVPELVEQLVAERRSLRF